MQRRGEERKEEGSGDREEMEWKMRTKERGEERRERWSGWQWQWRQWQWKMDLTQGQV